MIRLVWRNLLRNKRRTILTVLSVAMAIFLLVLLGSVLQAMTDVGNPSEASMLVVRNAISLTFQIPEAYGPRIAALPHVVAVTPLDWFQGVYKDNRPENFFPRFATDPETLRDVFTDVTVDEAQWDDFRRERTAFASGRRLAEKQGWEIGDVIAIKGDIYPVDLELTLRAIFTYPGNEGQENLIYLHRKYVQEAIGNPGTVNNFWLQIDDPENATAVIREIEGMFENSQAQVRAETAQAFALSFVNMLGNVRFLFGSIGLAIVVSILLITANTMAMAARERTREVAVLRTLGFRRGQVTAMVILEALVVGVVGSALGLAGATMVTRAIDPILQENGLSFSNLAIDPQRVAIGLAIGLLIGLIAGAFPAWTASRMKIVDGLRRIA